MWKWGLSFENVEKVKSCIATDFSYAMIDEAMKKEHDQNLSFEY